jgi:hypothetical protein
MYNWTTSKKVYKRDRLNKIYIIQINKQFVLLIIYLINSSFVS